jgi:hypothetical protein
MYIVAVSDFKIIQLFEKMKKDQAKNELLFDDRWDKVKDKIPKPLLEALFPFQLKGVK